MRDKFLIFLFSIFLVFPIGTYALTYTVNDNEYTVNSDETIRDFCYFTYYKNSSYDSFIVFYYDYTYPKCLFYNSSNDTSNVTYAWESLYKDASLRVDMAHISDDFSEVNFVSDTQLNGFNNSIHSLLYSNKDVYDFHDKVFDSNINFEDIESSYSSNNQNDNPVEKDSLSKVTKEDFYILLFLLSILIWLLYFKWCFPMKGGKKV